MINFRTAYKLKTAFAILILILIILVFILAYINKVSDTYLWTVVFPIEVALSTVLSFVGLDISKNYYNFLYFKDYNKGCELRDKYKIRMIEAIKKNLLNDSIPSGICVAYTQIYFTVIDVYPQIPIKNTIPDINRDIAIKEFDADKIHPYWWYRSEVKTRIEFLDYIINSIKNKSSK